MLDFKNVFELKCDACRVALKEFFFQEKRHIAFISEKLNEARKKWFTYEKELYAVFRSLKT